MTISGLRVTTAGVAALADQTNVGLAAVRFTHLALGDGSGPGGAADDDRVALRSERERIPVTGRASAGGRVGMQCTPTENLAYNVTEAGLFGTVAGHTVLLCYWSNAGAAWLVRDGTGHLISLLLVLGPTSADVAITVNPLVTFGLVDALTDLTDFPVSYANAAGKVLRVNQAGTAVEFVEMTEGGRMLATDFPTANVVVGSNATATVMSLSLRTTGALLRLAWRATHEDGAKTPANLRLRVDDGAWQSLASGSIAAPAGGGLGGPWRYGQIDSEGLYVPVAAGLVAVEMRATANAGGFTMDGAPVMSSQRWTYPSWLAAEVYVTPLSA